MCDQYLCMSRLAVQNERCPDRRCSGPPSCWAPAWSDEEWCDESCPSHVWCTLQDQTNKCTSFCLYVTGPARLLLSASRTLISCMGSRRANKEAKWLQPLASVASASILRSGEWGLPAQHLLARLRYIYNLYKQAKASWERPLLRTFLLQQRVKPARRTPVLYCSSCRWEPGYEHAWHPHGIQQ